MRKAKQHPHHFLLPEPSKDVPVVGKCKICGQTREHSNVIPHAVFNGWRGGAKTTRKKEVTK